jgi:Protein of unknown function (DUF4065)
MRMAKRGKKLTFSYPLERGIQRLRELIVYIAEKSVDDVHFGAIKLNKILYHSDFRAFERFGVPLTGVVYFRLPLGPAPRSMIPVRSALISEGAIRLDKLDLGSGYEQHRVVALRAPILNYFETDEIGIVNEVIAELWTQTAAEVSDASHDIRWRTLSNQDNLPYEFAFLSDETPTEEDIQRTRELIKIFSWE